MLKSTHKAAGLKASSSLPEGWTEHTAPSGHKYYYNASTKQSTYTRPVLEMPADTQHEEPLFAEESAPDPIMLATLRAQEEFTRNAQSQPGHFTGGRSYQQRPQRRGHGGDRPKKKKVIPGCEPWVLVYTKFGRRFVHNLETRESLWKFPQEVMMAVIEMESKEWKAKQEGQRPVDSSADSKKPAEPTGAQNTPPTQAPATRPTNEPGYDSSEYEEVEVTDDEADGASPSQKRPRLSPGPKQSPTDAPKGPAELTEDDIAWQLAQMEASDDEYDAAYADNDDPDPDNTAEDGAEEEDQGLEITAEDNLALFRALLDDTSTSPYATFESLLDLPQYHSDPRWLALPNMASRRDAFVSWSRDRVADIKAQASLRQQNDENEEEEPVVAYLRFLSEKASPKLYWPEFKRKWKKEGVMRGYEPSEKERERLYRDFVGRLKGKGAGERRRELGGWLKGLEKGEGGKVPKEVLRDVRYWVVEEREREEVVRAWLGAGG